MAFKIVLLYLISVIVFYIFFIGILLVSYMFSSDFIWILIEIWQLFEGVWQVSSVKSRLEPSLGMVQLFWLGETLPNDTSLEETSQSFHQYTI